ncbi:hypothetical protein [Pectobacterium polaris]|uniref:hypothetical protein n=1 Tax=Pectobacterium polaris TaxID=2042057 RepID=UPI00202D1E96|nr:hypothetical protein [Pectobacterium polaris]MCL6325072.1 hypothetical protein [Pectobacterium polaris]
MNNEEQLHEICHFMSQERLLTLSAAAEGQVWSASCFYHFQQDEMTMYVMSDITTRHASLMLKAPEVSGTITGSDISLMQLKGLQYQAVASLLHRCCRRSRRGSPACVIISDTRLVVSWPGQCGR